MINTLSIYEILQAAKIEEPKAKAITDAIVKIVEENNEDLGKSLMTKEDGHRLELKIEEVELRVEQGKNEIIRWVVTLGIALAGIVLGGVYFMLTHIK